MSQDLAQATELIGRLSADKLKLKSALAETLLKRDQFYSEAQYLRTELKQNLKTSRKHEEVPVNLVYITPSELENLQIEVAQLVERAQRTPSVYSLMKKHIGCSMALKNSMEQGRITASFSAVTAFAQDLVKARPACLDPFRYPTVKLNTQTLNSLSQSDSTKPQSPELLDSKQNTMETIKTPSELHPSESSVNPQKQLKSSALDSRPRWNVGSSSDRAIPPMWRQDGWTPNEMFLSMAEFTDG